MSPDQQHFSGDDQSIKQPGIDPAAAPRFTLMALTLRMFSSD